MRTLSPAATHRFAGVDVLRGVSILSVVLMHIQLFMVRAGRPYAPFIPARWFGVLFGNTLNGVAIFFAVSGFLITYTCLRRFGSLSALRPRVFYRIRFARIAPLLLAMLPVLSVLHLVRATGFIISGPSTLPRAVLAALTFHINWLESMYGELPALWDVQWSLSVEEMFYVFFPLACLLLLRRRKGMVAFAALLLALVVMGPLARTVWSDSPIWRQKSYLSSMDSIALGVITALLLRWCERGTKRLSSGALLGIAWAGIAMIAAMIVPWQMPWSQVLGRSGTWNTVMVLGVCCILFGTVLRGRPGRPWSAPLRWFGSHSYEVYLTHQFVVMTMSSLTIRLHIDRGRALILWTLATVLLAAALGWLVSRFFSEPMNRRLRGAAPPQPA